MLETLNCIRMGEVLFDENLQLFILCNNCHTDLRTLQDFRQHLEKCEGLEKVFQQGRKQFKYNTDKGTQLFGKTLKGIKEFIIYDYSDVEVTCIKAEERFIDLINIEEELLDPKWYSDLNVAVNNSPPQKSSKQYDELVEAVTPFVQFKENLKSNNKSSICGKSNQVKSSTELKGNAKETDKICKNVQFELPANKARSTAKRKLCMTKSVPIHFATQAIPAKINIAPSNTSPAPKVSKTYVSKKRKTDSAIPNGCAKTREINAITTVNSTQKNTNMLPPTFLPPNKVLISVAQKTTTTPNTCIKQEPTKEKQTAQILNKLQNLGLQVKRTQPAMANPSVSNNKTDTKTLEILQKLQSKGMKVKILNKQQTTETNVSIPIAKPTQGLVPNPAQKTSSVIRNPSANITIKQNLNKNLIIKKVN